MCFPFSLSLLTNVIALAILGLLVACLLPYASDRGATMCYTLIREPVCARAGSRVALGLLAMLCDVFIE